MRWSSFGSVLYGYMKIRVSIPAEIRHSMDAVVLNNNFSDYRFDKIERLGMSLGLKKSEILAATNLPIDSIRSGGRGRITLFGVLVSIIIVACICFGLALLLNNFHIFDPTPTYTYTPGTKYGSISPNDFSDESIRYGVQLVNFTKD